MTSDTSARPSDMKEQLKKRARPVDTVVLASLFICGAISIAVTIGILWNLGTESLLFFQDDRV